MILTGKEIVKQVKEGNIFIEGFDENKANPNSYNLTLNNKLLVYTSNVLDMKHQNNTTEITIPEEGLVLQPGTLYLGKTNERTFTDKYVPMLEGRSSIGRLGIYIHVTAGFGDIGFNGNWTLEIQCVQPVRIYPNVDICQIYYHTPQGDTSIQYDGKYQGDTEIGSSKLYEDFNEGLTADEKLDKFFTAWCDNIHASKYNAKSDVSDKMLMICRAHRKAVEDTGIDDDDLTIKCIHKFKNDEVKEIALLWFNHILIK